ncbi:MAG: acyl-CoA desaturase, partial [Pseudomonadota bacterium]
LTALTLCLGHSIGMHRKLIHQSFACAKGLERLLVYLGTLVGLGGPFTMMYTHDVRDWAQRSASCHDFLSHRRGILTDFWWQLHCKLHLEREPDFRFPPALKNDQFYRLLQASSMLQQVPLALLLFALGDLGWVAWGVCGRVSVSIFGHWLVGYIAHNGGERDWHVEGASTQGYNLRRLGLITFGECWHNNHHAFPGSARLGLDAGQFDPGWFVLQTFERLGLIWEVHTPQTLPVRAELVSLRA